MNARYPIPALRLCGAVNLPEGSILPQECRFRVEEEIKRSRFITSVGHAPDRETARCFIEAARREFPDATHNCWAYAAGRPGDSAIIGQSDDGEPHGTAGRPMLDQLLRSSVGEIVAVTTRYFGGIKLGTGGLARAYRGGVTRALATLPVKEKTVSVRLDVRVGYDRIQAVYRLLPEFQAVIAREEFGEDAAFCLELPDDCQDACRAALVQATDGTVSFAEDGRAGV